MPETARMQVRRDAGLCVSCGREPPVEARSKCAGCAEIAREAAAERRESAAKRKVCEACMVRPRWRGQTRCKTCRDKYLAAQLERDKTRRAKQD